MLCIGKYLCLRWCLLRSRCVLRKCPASPVSGQSCLFYLTSPFQRQNIEKSAENGYNEFDIRQKDTSTPCPRDFFKQYLNSDPVRRAIGAEVPFALLSDPVEAMFNTTGDVISSHYLCFQSALNPKQDGRSVLKQLQSLVNSKLLTLIWVGHVMRS